MPPNTNTSWDNRVNTLPCSLPHAQQLSSVNPTCGWCPVTQLPPWGQHTHQLTGQHKNREIIKKYYILTTELNPRASAMAGLPCKCQFGLNFTVGAVTRSIDLPWGWNKHSLVPWGNHSHENSIPKRQFTRWGSELNQQGLPPINPLTLN